MTIYPEFICIDWLLLRITVFSLILYFAIVFGFGFIYKLLSQGIYNCQWAVYICTSSTTNISEVLEFVCN